MEFIKDILSEYVTDEDKLNEVVDKLNKENPKHFIPKAKYNETSEALKVTKEQLESQKSMVEELSNKAESVEEYESKLSEWKTKYDELEQTSQSKIANITKKTQLKEFLLENNAHKDAIDLLIDKYSEEVEIDNDSIKDADKLIEKIKEERGGLFINSTQNSDVKNDNNTQNNRQKPLSEMSVEEYAEYYKQREEKRKDF